MINNFVPSLDFAEVKIINLHLAEVIINKDVLFTEELVEEYHNFLNDNLEAPFSLIVNKVNNYYYDDKAEKIIGNIKGVDKMAVVCYDRETETAQDKIKHPGIKIFKTRVEALNWISPDPLKIYREFYNYIDNRNSYSLAERSTLREYFKKELDSNFLVNL